jgi:hypothetical protein
MRATFTAAFLLSAALAAGCSRPAPAPAVPGIAAVPEPPDTSSLPLFDSPDYANWKRFPVGTMVKRKSVTTKENTEGGSSSVETLTLKEVNDKEVVVERQNTSERVNGERTANPPELRRFPRQFRIPAGMTAEDFSKPSRNAKKAGEEDLTVLGKSYKTTCYTWTDQNEAGKMPIKVWLSDEMPGRIVKQLIVIPDIQNKTVEEVIELRKP